MLKNTLLARMFWRSPFIVSSLLFFLVGFGGQFLAISLFQGIKASFPNTSTNLFQGLMSIHTVINVGFYLLICERLFAFSRYLRFRITPQRISNVLFGPPPTGSIYAQPSAKKPNQID